MTPPTYQPSVIYLEIDVSGLSLIDAERYFNDLRGGRLPDARWMQCKRHDGC